MQIEGISFNAVELTVTTDLWLPLIEIALGSRLAIELLYVVCARVKEVAMICLLIGRRKSTEDQDMLVRDLVETASLEADPVGVLLDAQVESLPVLSPLDVVLLD